MKQVSVSVLISAILIASTGTSLLITNHYESKLVAAYERGREDIDYKQLAESDVNLTNKLCYMWWFEMDHKVRNLDVPIRKRVK